jgi:hypothetical protein
VRRDLAQVEPARRLHGIGVHQRTRRMAPHHRRHRCDVGHRAHFVVHGHHAHHGHAAGGRQRVERVGQRPQVGGAHRANRHHRAVRLFHRVQHRMVLGSRAHGDTGPPSHRTEHRRVVALGAAAGEHHVARPAPQYIGHHLAGVVDRGARLAGEAV